MYEWAFIPSTYELLKGLEMIDLEIYKHAEECEVKIAILKSKLAIAVEALKSGIREGSKCHCQGYDVNNHKGYGLTDDIVIPLEEALSKINEEEK